MKPVIAIVGAGGKMGTRIVSNLTALGYAVRPVENDPAAASRISGMGLNVQPMADAVPGADMVILAVPDRLIGHISREAVPLMSSGSICILLDPAAPYLGDVDEREDCSFVIAHPCHPALFAEQDTLEAHLDHFGGSSARQDIVMALISGREEDFESARVVCSSMFGLTGQAFRVTVEQMAMLEPAAVEILAGSALCVLREATDDLIVAGIEEAAARSFMLGHIRVILAILFDQTEFPVSDAAKVAFEIGKEYLIKPDWKRAFDPGEIRKTVKRMIRGD